MRRLKSAIEEWKQQFLIIAPISGKVSLSKVWSRQQTVNAGEEVAAVVPTDGASKTIVKAVLPIANSGKVKTGLKSNIRIDAFPYPSVSLVFLL